jgi:hypothetical protein
MLPSSTAKEGFKIARNAIFFEAYFSCFSAQLLGHWNIFFLAGKKPLDYVFRPEV